MYDHGTKNMFKMKCTNFSDKDTYNIVSHMSFLNEAQSNLILYCILIFNKSGMLTWKLKVKSYWITFENDAFKM